MKREARGVWGYGVTVVLLLVLVWWGNRAVTVMTETAPVRRRHTVVIDAGHGGVDGGATSCTGKAESAFNLEISLRLRDLLHLLGCRTEMVRTSDVSVYTKGETIAQKKVSDLKERLRITEDAEGALLLSIHQNTFLDSRYSGAQVFYAGTEGSRELAEQLQKGFVTSLNPGSNRQVKPGTGIYLMERIRCPGVLIECGFLSNYEEEARLSGKDYQQKLCCVIAATTVSYLSNT